MKATTDAGASEATVWVGASDVREQLQARERIASTDSRTLWDEDRINNRPAYVSQDAPAGSLMYGDWNELGALRGRHQDPDRSLQRLPELRHSI